VSTSIIQTFVDLFGSETKLAYQRRGSKLRGLLRNVSGVGGDTFRFPKLGEGLANQKARHADVTPMNIQHSNVLATLADFFAPEFVDELDLLKTNESVRADLVTSIAWALGRKTDEIIVDAWNGSGTAGVTTGVITKTMVDEARETLDSGNVDMESRFAVIDPSAVTGLLNLAGDEFVDSDFRGDVGPASANAGRPIGMWRSFTWHVHTGLPLTLGGPDSRRSFFGHPSASGLVTGKEPQVTIDWIAQKVAWLINGKLSQGAVVIDAPGLIEFDIDVS